MVHITIKKTLQNEAKEVSQINHTKDTSHIRHQRSKNDLKIKLNAS